MVEGLAGFPAEGVHSLGSADGMGLHSLGAGGGFAGGVRSLEAHPHNLGTEGSFVAEELQGCCLHSSPGGVEGSAAGGHIEGHLHRRVVVVVVGVEGCLGVEHL